MADEREAVSGQRPPRLLSPGLLAAAGLCAVLAACSPDSSSDERVAGQTTVAAARVCADVDADGVCGPGEPSARTAADGSFSLWVEAGTDAALLVEVEAGVSIDAVTGEPYPQSFTLAAAAGHRHLITPFAALALDAPDLLGDRPEETLRAAFGIPAAVDVLPSAPIAGPARASSFARIAGTVYAAAQTQARQVGAAPREARRAAALRTLEAAPALAAFFAAALATSPPPPLNASNTATLNELMAGARQGLVLRDLPGGPGAFGAAYDEVKRSFLPGQQCVDPVWETLERTCRNQWAFEVEILSSAAEVVRKVHSAFGAKADVIVATASGNLTLDQYKRRYSQSLHVYVDASMKRCNYGITGALQSTYAPSYASAYDRFVAACGNRFLSDITTGGRLIGTFDKEFTSTEEKEAFQLQLKAKVAGITVYDHTWRNRANNAFAGLDMSVQILGTGGHLSLENGTLETLTQRIEAFSDRVHSPECAADDAYATCAYTGSFADYGAATGLAKDPARAFDRLRDNYYRWLEALSAYEAALARAADVVAHPDRYHLADSPDPFYDLEDQTGTAPDPAPSLEEVQAWTLALPQEIGALEAAADACRAELARCTTSPGEKGYLAWSDLLRRLPRRKLFVHANCTELSYQFGYAVDGEYTAYYGGDFTKPYRAQCRSMASAQPETYLVLPDTSPDASNLTANYSLRVDADGRQTERLVRALRLHPAGSNEDDRLQAFVPTEEPYVETTFAADPRQPPLLAATCGAATARANLDLGGTPFRFAAAVAGFVVDQDGRQAPCVLSPDRKALEITARSTGGDCVWVALVPPTDGIDLEYAP
jgi:hypothetical protein